MKKRLSLLLFIANWSLLIAPHGALAQISPSPAVLSQLQVQVTLLAPADTAGWSDMERAALPRRVSVIMQSTGEAPAVQVRLGTQPGLSDLGLRTFPQGVLGALPNGSSIAQTGPQVVAQLDPMPDLGYFYLTVDNPSGTPLQYFHNEFQ
jgi:hypothetical protein